jgi:hypothetical protein
MCLVSSYPLTFVQLKTQIIATIQTMAGLVRGVHARLSEQKKQAALDKAELQKQAALDKEEIFAAIIRANQQLLEAVRSGTPNVP